MGRAVPIGVGDRVGRIPVAADRNLADFTLRCQLLGKMLAWQSWILNGRSLRSMPSSM
jgi:hypothetical protein